MAKYIDAEKLKAEIERKISICEQQRTDAINVECYNLADDASARMGELHVLLETITSLQYEQPEVDLEKEINMEISKWTCYEEIGFGARYDAKPFDGRDIEKIARHFYELGLNARKEE